MHRTASSLVRNIRIQLGFLALAVAACAASPRTASSQPLRHQGGGYELEVLVNGAATPTFSHRGETYLQGSLGDRYVLRVHNRTGARVEAVVSVDGRDAIDGKTADFRNKRGYLVPAWGFVDVEGWRLSGYKVAAFRFSRVADSYAARTGSAREVGVIGVAIFPERKVPVVRRWNEIPYGLRDSPRADDLGEAAGSRGMSADEAAPAQGAPQEYEAQRKSAAPLAKGESRSAPPRSRPGLGTEFGESLSSPIREVSFVRQSTSHPALVLGARYNDRHGLIAMGVDVDGPYWGHNETHLRRTADPFPQSGRPYAAPPAGWNRGR